MQGDVTHATKLNRLSELDAMRGIAALCVVFYHFNNPYLPYNPDYGHLPMLFGWGRFGVQIFFAISGFVICMTLERMNSVATFAKARFRRLFPTYWAAMIVTITVVGLAGPEKLMVNPQQALFNTTMLHYWFDVKGVDGSYWTLSIELSFYLVMAMLLRFGLLARLELVLLGWLTLHVLQTDSQLFSGTAARIMALDHIPFFAIGMIHYRYYRGLINGRHTAIWYLVLMAIATLTGWWAVILTALIIGIFSAMTSGFLRFLTHPVLLWLGAISYPLYLIHQYIAYVLIDRMAGAGVPLFGAMLITLPIVVALGHFLHISVEQPAQRLFRNVGKRPQLVPAE